MKTAASAPIRYQLEAAERRRLLELGKIRAVLPQATQASSSQSDVDRQLLLSQQQR